jgi:hypothetical protein
LLCYEGKWNKAGAIVKTKLQNEQLRNPTRSLQNAADVVPFLRETLSVRVTMSSAKIGRGSIHRYFHEVTKTKKDFRTKPWECASIDGS